MGNPDGATHAADAARLNAADQAEFVALLDGTYEHSPWVAEAPGPGARGTRVCHAGRSCGTRWQAVREAGPRGPQLALIRAHPELAGKAMVSKSLTAESTHEQGKAGLTDCTPEEFAHIQQLNADYNAASAGPSSWPCAGRAAPA
jgi:N-carbamoyl-L-amino-acid hydrolase